LSSGGTGRRPPWERRRSQSKRIERTYRIPDKSVNVLPSSFLDWITVWPPPCARIVVAVSVVEISRLVVLIFGREPERIDEAQRPGGAEEFSEGAFGASPRARYKTLAREDMRATVRTGCISEVPTSPAGGSDFAAMFSSSNHRLRSCAFPRLKTRPKSAVFFHTDRAVPTDVAERKGCGPGAGGRPHRGAA
jgi:hypothetical protein